MYYTHKRRENTHVLLNCSQCGREWTSSSRERRNREGRQRNDWWEVGPFTSEVLDQARDPEACSVTLGSAPHLSTADSLSGAAQYLLECLLAVVGTPSFGDQTLWVSPEVPW